MNELSRILAAVDPSEPARAAFDHALALSRAHGAELTVVHAVPTNHRFSSRGAMRGELIAKLRQMAASSGVRFAVSVQQGDPAGVILLHARARRPDLIVMGTHQRTGLDRLRSGSVAERVAQQATQPVLIVPARNTTDTAPSLDRIVVAVDFSAASNRALEQALALARTVNGRATVLHVVPGFSSASVPRYLYRYGVAEYQNLLAQDAWRRLQDAVPHDATTEAQIHARVVIGEPHAEIASIAEEVDADVIVLGVTQRGGFSRKVFGSTAARVMRVAGRPILAVPELTSRAASPADANTQSFAA
jgi:nucleotide-binding universal stress UspA family protein